MIGPRVKYLVLFRDAPIATISLNRASLHVGARDAWFTWREQGRRTLLPHVVNNRFLIMPWVRIKNLASHLLSQSLRRLKTDWLRLYGVPPYAMEPFVNLNCYPGTCYQAANWRCVGETRGFGKVGKTFVYHGNRKGVFLYLLDRKLLKLTSQFPGRPNPYLERARVWDMMLSAPDWSPELFAEAGLNGESVADFGSFLSEYLHFFSPCFSRRDQQQKVETYMRKGMRADMRIVFRQHD